MENVSKVYIYGTGKYWEWSYIYIRNTEILGYISTGENGTYSGKMLFPSLTKDMEEEMDYLIIANIHTDEIIRDLMRNRFISWEKVLVLEPTQLSRALEISNENSEILDSSFTNLYSARYGCKKVEYLKMPLPNMTIGKMISPEEDPVRKLTLKMLANEIYQNKINGDIAEFGVFTGEFAKEMNVVFADRKLFLFDTFEGFPERDAEKARKNVPNVDVFLEACKNTSIEIVMSKLANPDMCEICKGIFPESAINISDFQKFSFVSIDVDFMDNTLAGLQYFYPKLSKGGYIMLHDYNNKSDDGDFGAMVKKAVSLYEDEIGGYSQGSNLR